MNEIPGSQIHLTEKLHLMQELGYSDIHMHEMSSAIFRYRNADDSDAQNDLDLLDVIATCLTTRKPGDIVAAAFDKRKHVSLVLAKSGNVDSADYAATHAFLSALREARCWIDLLPFLAKHSKQNVDKRVRNLRESITDLCDELKPIAMNYTFDSMEEEFPRSRRYRKAKYPEEPPIPQSFLFDLIHSCISNSTEFDLQVDTSSRSQYIQLFGAADALRRSFFLSRLVGKYFEGADSKLKGRVKRLKRRLDKVCQYAKIDMLMRLAKRLPNISFRWVEDDVVGTGEESLEICKDVTDVVERMLSYSQIPKSPATLLRRCPELRKNWEQQRTMNLCIHPEIRIVLHLSLPLLSGLLSPQNENDSTYLPIGCSKTSCLCCMLWIDAFNEITGMLWVTSGSHGKPRDNWALPGAAGEMKQVERWRDFDAAVTDGVHWRLYTHLV